MEHLKVILFFAALVIQVMSVAYYHRHKPHFVGEGKVVFMNLYISLQIVIMIMWICFFMFLFRAP